MTSRIDRRALLKSSAATALLSASGLSVDAAPRYGGRLRLAIPHADKHFESVVLGAVYHSLTNIDANGLLRDELATEWRCDRRARNWKLKLRDNIKFHNGEKLTVQDVANSLINTNFDVESHPSQNSLFIHLNKPDPHLPYRLADIAPIITKTGEKINAMNGTGLYRVKRLHPERHFIGDRVKPHQKETTSGWLSEIEIIVISDSKVRHEALRDNFVDAAEFHQAESLPISSDWSLITGAQNTHIVVNKRVGIPPQTGQRKPLDDNRIAERWWMT
ncbi:MAG: ABC transporter substrate-binding protein [Aestuariivita sp.]|nr:ABC transporter substrate-binding protein [Aestuariivita sp.]